MSSQLESAQTYAVDTKTIELQFTRMAIAPNVHRDRPITPVTSIIYNVQDSTADNHTGLPGLAQSFSPDTPQVLQGANCTKMTLTWPDLIRIERFKVRWLPCRA